MLDIQPSPRGSTSTVGIQDFLDNPAVTLVRMMATDEPVRIVCMSPGNRTTTVATLTPVRRVEADKDGLPKTCAVTGSILCDEG